MASKYDPLRRYLESRPGAETPMSFADVERVLGFSLPPSARDHAAWWSNNVGTNVAVAAWRNAGWKTSRVDMAAERVTFVRDEAAPAVRSSGMAEGGATWDGATGLAVQNLSLGAQRMIDDWAEEAGLDRAAAAAAILEALAASRRRQLLDSLPLAVMPPGYDSTEIIRADRDSH
jgi:hypothetical protein